DVPFRVLRPPIERAELTVGDAHVRVVDVPVDDVGDHVLGVQAPPRPVGEVPQLEQGRALVQLYVGPELRALAIEHGQATCRNWTDPSGTRPWAANRRKKALRPARCLSLRA